MTRTKKLMTTVTTSLLLTGAPPWPESPAALSGQTAAKKDEPWKTDPQVKKAAEQIEDWLDSTDSTSEDHAKTKSEIVKQFPGLSPSLMDNALKRLMIYSKVLKQAGDGSEAHPYRYYLHVGEG
jgi:hypothetical protein